MDRRRFLQQLGASAAALSLPLHRLEALAQSDASPGSSQASPPLDILVLGGTRFLGPAIVDAALAEGHTVTLFNRGKSAPDMFPELETIIGDRDGGLEGLEGRNWDCVIDTSGYVPRIVSDSATLLADHVGQYVFISTKSVYASLPEPNITEETGEIAVLEDPTVEQVTGESYGALKALCEQAAEEAMPGRVWNLRPGLIVGPRDRSDRFTYWPVRIARGGEVLAPGSGEDWVQYIDVRDFGEWIVRGLGEQLTGVYNVVTPAGRYQMRGFLEEIREGVNSTAGFTWVDADFLEANEVAAYREMPCWVPQVEGGEYWGFARLSSQKAQEAGLRFRDLELTARDTLEWWAAEPEERRLAPMKAGLDTQRETELLARWRAYTPRG
jgi:2'-hydroxyisoflavone reductase